MGQHFLDSRAAIRLAALQQASGIAASVRIATRRGFVAAGDLRAGDDLLTRDSGYCTIKAITPLGLQPCGSPKGAALWLRPDHGVVARDASGAEVLFPLRRLLAPGHARIVRHLTFAIMLDRHEILCAEGGWIESTADGSSIPARPRAEAGADTRPGTMRNFRVAGGGGRA